MEKKKGIKTRFMAGALALMLSGAPATLVKAEEQIVKNMDRVELVEMLSTEENMEKLDYATIEGIKAHKYVSEDGTIEKWYISYLDKIDGLKRTNETILIPSYYSLKDEQCDIEEKHAHLYLNYARGCFRPYYCENYSYTDNKSGEIFYKTNIITNIDEKTLQLLIDYDLYRVSDQVVETPNVLKYFLSLGNGITGLVYLEPISMEDGKLTVNIHCINDYNNPYCQDWMNGFLIDPKNNVLTVSYSTLSEEEKTYVYEKKY